MCVCVCVHFDVACLVYLTFHTVYIAFYCAASWRNKEWWKNDSSRGSQSPKGSRALNKVKFSLRMITTMTTTMVKMILCRKIFVSRYTGVLSRDIWVLQRSLLQCRSANDRKSFSLGYRKHHWVTAATPGEKKSCRRDVADPVRSHSAIRLRQLPAVLSRSTRTNHEPTTNTNLNQSTVWRSAQKYYYPFG